MGSHAAFFTILNETGVVRGVAEASEATVYAKRTVTQLAHAHHAAVVAENLTAKLAWKSATAIEAGTLVALAAFKTIEHTHFTAHFRKIISLLIMMSFYLELLIFNKPHDMSSTIFYFSSQAKTHQQT